MVILFVLGVFSGSVTYFLTLNGFWAGRLRFAIGSILGILFLYIAAQTNLFFGKNKERKIARCHCSKYTHSDCNYLLCQSHATHLVGSSFSLSLSHCSSHFRSTVSRSTISIIVGIIKESAPKRIRHTSETRIPIIEETWIFSFIH